MTNEDVKQYIISWNYRFPIDRWWRKKYNIAFNSHGHRESSFIDQLIEWEEEKLFNSFEQEEYVPGKGDWLKRKQPESVEETVQSMRDEYRDDFKELTEDE